MLDYRIFLLRSSSMEVFFHWGRLQFKPSSVLLWSSELKFQNLSRSAQWLLRNLIFKLGYLFWSDRHQINIGVALAIKVLGGSSKHQILGWKGRQADPIPFGYIKVHVKFQNPSWSGSAAARPHFSDLKIQRILNIYKGKNLQTHFSIFIFSNSFLAKIRLTCVIAEVQTLL
jgi:hypothetical protein